MPCLARASWYERIRPRRSRFPSITRRMARRISTEFLREVHLAAEQGDPGAVLLALLDQFEGVAVVPAAPPRMPTIRLPGSNDANASVDRGPL